MRWPWRRKEPVLKVGNHTLVKRVYTVKEPRTLGELTDEAWKALAEGKLVASPVENSIGADVQFNAININFTDGSVYVMHNNIPLFGGKTDALRPDGGITIYGIRGTVRLGVKK